jgi:hypothetical protein
MRLAAVKTLTLLRPPPATAAAGASVVKGKIIPLRPGAILPDDRGLLPVLLAGGIGYYLKGAVGAAIGAGAVWYLGSHGGVPGCSTCGGGAKANYTTAGAWEQAWEDALRLQAVADGAEQRAQAAAAEAATAAQGADQAAEDAWAKAQAADDAAQAAWAQVHNAVAQGTLPPGAATALEEGATSVDESDITGGATAAPVQTKQVLTRPGGVTKLATGMTAGGAASMHLRGFGATRMVKRMVKPPSDTQPVACGEPGQPECHGSGTVPQPAASSRRPWLVALAALGLYAVRDQITTGTLLVGAAAGWYFLHSMGGMD